MPKLVNSLISVTDYHTGKLYQLHEVSDSSAESGLRHRQKERIASALEANTCKSRGRSSGKKLHATAVRRDQVTAAGGGSKNTHVGAARGGERYRTPQQTTYNRSDSSNLHMITCYKPSK